MKKVALTILGIILVAGTVSAQRSGFGVKAGVNMSTQYLSDDYGKLKQSYSTGFTGGVFGMVEGKKGIGFTAELLYSAQGSKEKHEGFDQYGNEVANIIYRTHYLNLPLTLSYKVIGGLAVRAGLQPGVKLVARSISEFSDRDYKVDIANSYTTFDLTAPVGLFYEFPLGIIVDARYNIGIVNIASKSDSAIDVKQVARNNFFSFTVGYKF